MNDYGLRWREFTGRDARLTTKEKWFKSAEARQRFAGKVSEKGGFHEFLAWCDPKVVDPMDL
jgi:hypothetical protein